MQFFNGLLFSYAIKVFKMVVNIPKHCTALQKSRRLLHFPAMWNPKEQQLCIVGFLRAKNQQTTHLSVIFHPH